MTDAPHETAVSAPAAAGTALPTTAATTPSVLCFGEILWDFLPAGLFAGGAPFNVAYHLHRHGVNVLPVSAVGRDVLGDELLRRLDAWSISTAAIHRDSALPTGYVRARISAAGDAHYEIVEAVAWDAIVIDALALHAQRRAAALVHGSLALRSAANRVALDQLINALPAKAWRVFDVNLRAPYDDVRLCRTLARDAALLKVNAAEAARLCHAPVESAQPYALEQLTRQLVDETGCLAVCVTAAGNGAGLFRDGRWSWVDGQPTQVADTIGAGDAFLASLLTHLLGGKFADAECLARACRLGEWVASQCGATPDYTDRTPV